MKDLKKFILKDISYIDFYKLGDFPYVDELSPLEKDQIGNPSTSFNKGLANFSDYLMNHIDEHYIYAWNDAFESLKRLAKKGYPGANLSYARVLADFVRKGELSIFTRADSYFKRAKESPYASADMIRVVEEYQQTAERNFDNTYPDLTKKGEKKDFTSIEYSKFNNECFFLKMDATRGMCSGDDPFDLVHIGRDEEALKRLEILAERGYPPAQKYCGYLALDDWNFEQAYAYLNDLKNNQYVLVEGKSIQTATDAAVKDLSKAISEKWKAHIEVEAYREAQKKKYSEASRKESSLLKRRLGQITGAVLKKQVRGGK